MDELLLASCAAIESGFNTLIGLDPESRRRLASMQGKVIAVRLKEIDLQLIFLPTDRDIQIYHQFEGEPDTTIIGTPVGMVNMALGNSEALFQGEVEIEGDIELGQQFKRLLDKLDIDWEEQLSHYTGDALAHQFGRFLNDGFHWGKRTLSTLAGNVTEYMQQESRDLPTNHEVQPFLRNVDQFRDDLARLEARIHRLHKTLGEKE
ncbi:MAG: SCP2 sterol-binding domain-containing protein [Gammaproteobacteria bacterium]|nr:SCP2 sterol-binding domain-containing protein [Gammaproteobacteria bacterium]